MEIALFQPEIPPNTGNIARLSVCTSSRLHIVGEPSFSLEESAVRRAGLDYWHLVDLHRHENWSHFREYVRSRRNSAQGDGAPRLYIFTRFAERVYSDAKFKPEDILLFGSESRGLPREIVEECRKEDPESLLRLPVSPVARSLNLSNSVAVALYEGLRQCGFPGLLKSWEESVEENTLL